MMYNPTLSQMTLNGVLGASSPIRQNPIACHPHYWNRDDVQTWLKWCIDEYALNDIDYSKFPMNGKALCVLKKEDFVSRAPNAGDILYNTLQKIIEKSTMPQVHSPLFNIPSLNFFPSLQATAHALASPLGVPSSLGFPIISDSHNHMSSRSTLQVPPRATRSLSPSISSVDGVPRKPLIGHRHSISLPLPETIGSQEKEKSISSFVAQAGPVDLRVPNLDNVLSPPPSNSGDVTDCSGSEAASPKQEFIGHEKTAGFSAPSHSKDDDIDFIDDGDDLSMPTANNGDSRLLWEFISRLLTKGECTHLVRWENYDLLIFKIVNPSGLAHLWGVQKNRNNMTYEKMSRALRYYYKMGIIQKVQGKRLTYRFMKPPNEIKRSRRGMHKSYMPENAMHSQEVLHSQNMQHLHTQIQHHHNMYSNCMLPDHGSTQTQKIQDNKEEKRLGLDMFIKQEVDNVIQNVKETHRSQSMECENDDIKSVNVELPKDNQIAVQEPFNLSKDMDVKKDTKLLIQKMDDDSIPIPIPIPVSTGKIVP